MFTSKWNAHFSRPRVHQLFFPWFYSIRPKIRCCFACFVPVDCNRNDWLLLLSFLNPKPLKITLRYLLNQLRNCYHAFKINHQMDGVLMEFGRTRATPRMLHRGWEVGHSSTPYIFPNSQCCFPSVREGSKRCYSVIPIIIICRRRFIAWSQI